MTRFMLVAFALLVSGQETYDLTVTVSGLR
jgi:hypothetical protein